MLLIERILSLFIFVIILFIVLFFLFKLKKRYSMILNIYILLLSIMGYYYKPLTGKGGNINEGADLNRIWYYFDYYSFETFDSLWKAVKNSTSPGVNLYYFMISKLNNKHFLPAITAFITFYFCFGIIKTILKRDKEICSKEIIVSIFLFMSRGLFLQTISNIRTLLGLSIVAWCIYQEFYNNKKIKNLLIYYILAASFHSIVQVICLYRIFYFFIEKKKDKKNRIKMMLISSISIIIILVLGKEYILKILLKAKEYIEFVEYFYIWEYLISMILIVVILYIINIFKKYYRIGYKKRINNEYSICTYRLINYMKPLLYIDFILSFIEFSSFHRINWYLSILSIPLVIYTLKQERIVFSKKNKLIKNLMLISLIILSIACIRGDLCGLNFFISFN